MQKLKKILLCFFTFLVSLTMFGCAQVKFDTRLASNGAIISNINIDLNEGYLYQSRVSLVLQEYFKQLNAAYDENLVTLFSNIYDFDALDTSDDKSMFNSVEKKANYICEKNQQYIISKDLIADDDYKEFDFDSQKHTIKFQKTFISIYAYVMYFYPSAFEYNAEKNAVVISSSYKSMIDIPMAGEFKEDESLYINKYIQACVPFYYNGEEPKFLKDGSGTYRDAVAGKTLAQTLSEETGMTEEQVKLVFSFTTPYKRLHSNGSFSETDKGYTHTFTLNNMHSTVTFWRTYANYPAWYITAAIIGFLVLIVGFIIVKTILNIKKKKGLKALKKLDELARSQNEKKD